MNCFGCEDCPFEIDKGPIGFHELHITVTTRDVARFSKLCLENGIKPIIIEFQNFLTEGTETQMMTSIRVNGSREDALEKAEWARKLLSEHFTVSRTKIESAPIGDQDWSSGYFESHLQFQTTNRSALAEVAKNLGLRLSANPLKQSGDLVTQMATLRERNSTPDEFRSKMEAIRSQADSLGFPSEKLIVEFCWLDTNEGLDRGWG